MKTALLKKQLTKESGKSKSIQDDLKEDSKAPTLKLEDNRPESKLQEKLLATPEVVEEVMPGASKEESKAEGSEGDTEIVDEVIGKAVEEDIGTESEEVKEAEEKIEVVGEVAEEAEVLVEEKVIDEKEAEILVEEVVVEEGAVEEKEVEEAIVEKSAELVDEEKISE